MSDTWIGIGVSGGGILGIGGAGAMYSQLYSTDTMDQSFVATSDRGRWGVGLGGGVKLSLVVAMNAPDPSALQGLDNSGVDFAISLGGRWGSVVKTIGKSPRIMRILTRVTEAVSRAGFNPRTITQLNPDEYAELVSRFREGFSLGSAGGTPGIQAFEIPMAGAGLELSLYWASGSWDISHFSPALHAARRAS